MIKRGPPAGYPGRFPSRFPVNYPRRLPITSSINHFPDKIPPKKKETSNLSTSTKILVGFSLLILSALIIFLIVKGFSGDNDKDDEIDKFTSDLKISNAQLLNYSDINVNITPPKEEENVESIVFIFYTNGSEMTRRKIPIENLSNANFEIIFHFANASRIDKISVMPVFRSESGEEVQGKVEDQYVFDASSSNNINTNITNQTHPDDYLENGTFICKHDSQCEDNNNCTRNVCSNGNCTYIKNPNCISCEFQYECEDLNPCTSNKCMNGVCIYLAIPNCITCYSAIQCQDNNACTEDICFNERCMHNKITNCTSTTPINNQSNVTNNTQPILECLTSSDCEDYDSCTRNLCSLNKCVYNPIITCTSNDGCCPSGRGCTFINDNDCLPVCGNNIKEGTEQCDGTYLGGATCAGVLGVGYTGNLLCSDCRFNSSLCVPPCSQTCASLGYKCGTRTICGERVYCGDCPDGYICDNNGTCMNRCISESSASLCNRLDKDCGSATGVDNCGVRRTVDCGGCLDGYDCNTQGQCIQTTPQCSNECNQLKLRVCYSSSNYIICGANYDSDSCLEWSDPITCSTGSCSNGQCVSLPNCINGCDYLGQKECYGTGYHTCVSDYDSDSCLEWGSVTPCSSGCSGGDCNSAPPEPEPEPVVEGAYYVATPSNGGSDSNPGTFDRPWATWQKGFNSISPGDTLYIRGGTYYPTGEYIYYANYPRYVGVLVNNKDGTSNNPYRVFAYPGETPVLDCRNMRQAGTHMGILLFYSNYWHLKGLTITRADQYSSSYGAEGFENYASENTIIENCVAHHNGGPGFGSRVQSNGVHFINCDAYANYDPYTNPPGEDADGFDVGYAYGNPTIRLTGCRAWDNADDGFDIYQGSGYSGIFYLKDCWAWHNGYIPGTETPAGNGCGFKYGDDPQSYDGVTRRYSYNCIAYDNRERGFSQESANVKKEFYNCISYNNHGWGWSFYGLDIPDVLRNNVAFGDGIEQLGSRRNSDHNSWDSSTGVSVSSADFVSVDGSQLDNPRKSDGSLPDITFLHLKSDSDLINKGTPISGISYLGSAPDLGAFERE